MEEFMEVNEISDFISYIRSIEWGDPWLIALLSFHVLVTVTCFSTRNYGNFQILLFIMLLLLVYFSDNINQVAAKNWATFSRQQYFDSKGLFISIVFSIPILLNCMIMVTTGLAGNPAGFRVDAVIESTIARFCIDVNTKTSNCRLHNRIDSITTIKPQIENRAAGFESQGSWLYQSTQLMANIKTAQLRQRLKELNSKVETKDKYVKSD